MSTHLPNPALDLDQFKLSSATFEARSIPNYLLWDRSGTLWSELLLKRPQLQVVQAAPDNSSFKLEKRYFLAVALKTVGVVDEHTSLSVTDEKPQASLAGFVECAEEFLNAVTQILEIDEFTRVGMRLMFVREYADLESANDALLRTKLVQYPAGPHFGIEGKPTSPYYLLKWENDTKGAMVHLNTETRKIEFTPPAGLTDVEGFEKEVSRLIYDFDYYTRAPVARSQLRVPDWINNALHLVRRDSAKFLGGL